MTTPQTTREAAAVNAVAREALRRIAQERISPTPETYARIYAEVARTHPDHPAATSTDGGQEARQLAATITRLFTQVEAHHNGITVTRKREGLKRALVPRAEPLDALRSRLDRLMASWSGPNADMDAVPFLGTDVMGSPPSHDVQIDPLSASQAFVVPTHVLGSLQQPAPVRHDAREPVGASLRIASASELPDRVTSIRLAGLLALVLKNIEELTPESGLLSNQIEQIGRVLTAPLTEKKLDEAERCLRALIVRQGAIKQSMDETKRSVRDLASTLLDRLSTLVTSTDCYSTKVVDMAQRIAEATDLGQLSDLTQMLVADTRLMSSNMAGEHSLLLEAQARAVTLQKRTEALENELREASTLVRTDPLTRAMNRRGFSDAFVAEMHRSASMPPVIALLDVDNFKHINEAFGHAVGDEVLCRLVEVLHRAAQPADTVARYGGEEFALILPRMALADAERTVLRMQRALRESAVGGTPEQPAVTFSAGIAQVDVGESLAQAMTRADAALREAKHAGKNCVVVATRPTTERAVQPA